MRVRGRADMSLRDITIAQDGKQGLASANDITHRKHAENFGNLKSVSWELDTKRDGWLLLAHGELCGGCHMCWWGRRWKSQNTKIVPLPPYVAEPLNSKVIKGFVPELRSRYVFFVFWDPMFLSLWTFDVHFTHSHIMAMVQKYMKFTAMKMSRL